MKLIFLLITLMTCAAPVWAGEEDLAYFKQFLYNKEVYGNDPDFPSYSYHFVSTSFENRFQMPDGRFLGAVDSIFLFEDQTFLIRHQEYVFDKPDSTSFFPGGCRKITGHWSVPDKKLILEGVGTGERAMVNNRYGFRLTYDRDIVQPGLKGQTADAGPTISGSGDPLQWPCW